MVGVGTPEVVFFFSLKCIYASMFVRLFPFLRQPPPLLWKRENSWLLSAAARRGRVGRGSALTLRQDGGRLRQRLKCTACRSGGRHGRPNVTGRQFAACTSFLPFTSFHVTSSSQLVVQVLIWHTCATTYRSVWTGSVTAVG